MDDLEEAERFYGEVLGEILDGRVANRYGLTTDEVIQARRASALAARRGEESFAGMLPYSRVLLAGGRSHVYLCLAAEHRQEAPPEQLRGAPRLAFRVTAEVLARVPEILARHNVRFEGPMAHPPPSPVAEAVYFRDPAGNFLELCCPR